ncbi:PAS domain-containing protein [Hyphomicrobium sp. 1Nfss2.1]|uniref:PAS domain-containing protein n=1 Tax=Hyphomicrobium sp. 1Nfss2.1 TaxID=3413936 RepID=UPI003C7D3810
MQLKHKTSQTLFAYWEKVRGNRATPRRFEIDPGKIAGILPSTFILERLDSENYRFRLAGTHVCDMFGSELRGTNFLSGWSHSDRTSLVRHLAALSKQGAIETVHLEAAPVARASTSFEAILLPLRHTGDTIDRVLGALAPLDPPQWLGELPLTSKRIISQELTWPAGIENAAQKHPTDAAVPVMHPGTHARVVRSDHRQFRVFEGGLSRSDGDKA